MKNKFSVICVAAMTVLALSCSAGEAKREKLGEHGGPIAHILEHAKELNLTPEQVTKLEALQKEIVKDIAGKVGNGELREKLKDHPELLKEMKEARESGDEAKMKALREKVREHMQKNGGGPGEAKGGEIREKMMAILTPDQMKQVKEIMEEARAKNGGFGPGGKEEKGQKPDTSKQAPKVFE